MAMSRVTPSGHFIDSTAPAEAADAELAALMAQVERRASRLLFARADLEAAGITPSPADTAAYAAMSEGQRRKVMVDYLAMQLVGSPS
jgi:hypothetical protein